MNQYADDTTIFAADSSTCTVVKNLNATLDCSAIDPKYPCYTSPVKSNYIIAY